MYVGFMVDTEWERHMQMKRFKEWRNGNILVSATSYERHVKRKTWF